MKRLSFYITLLCIVLGTGVSISFAQPSAIPIIGVIPADTTGVGNAGTGIFNWDTPLIPPVSGTGEVYIDPGKFFHGNFLLRELSNAANDGTNTQWTTFNICNEQQDGTTPNPTTCTLSGGATISTGVIVHLVDSGDGNIFYMTGLIWSQ